MPDLAALESALGLGFGLVRDATARLAALTGGGRTLDDEQVLAYDLAHAAAGLETARAAAAYGRLGPDEARIAVVFAADVLGDLVARTAGREASWGTEPGWHRGLGELLSSGRSPALMAKVADHPGPMHLDPDFEMVRDAFRRFATERIAPLAEHIHRQNTDIPEEIIEGLAEMGGFGLSVPEEYGGAASGGRRDYLGMVVATEELSRASLGAGGSLVTRPEILCRALVRGGTEHQKQRLLPKIATGELMVAIAVTEPDYGSDVASVSTTAARDPNGGWVLNGVKTWCTFAARAEVLMLLARTDPDRTAGHRGLSVFVVPKPQGPSNGLRLLPSPRRRRRLRARKAGPPGSRPDASRAGRSTRSVTGACTLTSSPSRTGGCPTTPSLGVTRVKAEASTSRCRDSRTGGCRPPPGRSASCRRPTRRPTSTPRNRRVFGRPILDYQLTRAKLGKMAAMIQASRQFAYGVAAMMAGGEGSLEASMVKAYVCRAAEWVTREAMQLHGGMGYAEEFAVSRWFVDARVLSIFEGADETLCLKVIARRLVEQAAAT